MRHQLGRALHKRSHVLVGDRLENNHVLEHALLHIQEKDLTGEACQDLLPHIVLLYGLQGGRHRAYDI